VFALARTKSFKTTSTDALLVFANVEAIDFTVMKTAYISLSASNYVNFSCSTKKWLGKYFPDALSLVFPLSLLDGHLGCVFPSQFGSKKDVPSFQPRPRLFAFFLQQLDPSAFLGLLFSLLITRMLLT
jgi:hypothetical protein